MYALKLKATFCAGFFFFLIVYSQNLTGIYDSKEVEEPLTQVPEFDKDDYSFPQTMNNLHSQLSANRETCDPGVV